MPSPIEEVRIIHAESLRKHELHMTRFNRMLVAYLAFAALVVFSSVLVLSSPELLGVREVVLPDEYRFTLTLTAAMGGSLFAFIAWQQWRITRFTRLTIRLLQVSLSASSDLTRRDV